MRILYCKYTYYMIKSRRKKKGVFDMATTTNLNIRTDKEIKEAAEYIFNELPEYNPILSLEEVVNHRKTNPEEGSYTCYLFEKGLDKILKKVGEECSETIIAAKNLQNTANRAEDEELLVGEVADLIYHLEVMLAESGVSVQAVLDELEKRSHKIGNLKKMKTVDRNT